MWKPLARAASFVSARKLSISVGDPYLVRDHHHHEQKVKSKSPEDQEFGSFESPPRDEMLLGPSELIVLERR
jgi:hypothetical protein